MALAAVQYRFPVIPGIGGIGPRRPTLAREATQSQHNRSERIGEERLITMLVRMQHQKGFLVLKSKAVHALISGVC